MSSDEEVQRMNPWPAIATAYRQYSFRSRLEAKWAVFFDLCCWQWSYEPIDLNGWIPDFAIGEYPTLVEIKPFFTRGQWGPTVRKIIRSGCKEPVILLGADPTWTRGDVDEWGGEQCFGYLLDLSDDDDETPENFWDLHFGFGEGNSLLGLCSMEGAWINRIWKIPSGCDSGNKWSRVSLSSSQREEFLVGNWAKACNVSQWIPNHEGSKRSSWNDEPRPMGSLEERRKKRRTD